jgi:hypothetical protein
VSTLLTGDKEINEPLGAAFPLFQGGEYDFYLPELSMANWPSIHPEGLKRKTAAAVVSEFMGLGSVDYVLKRYLARVTYREEDGSRLDLCILWISLWICGQLHSSIK